jgi:hypothetical protein
MKRPRQAIERLVEGLAAVEEGRAQAQRLLDAAADDSNLRTLRHAVETMQPVGAWTIIHLVWAARGQGELEVRQAQRARRADAGVAAHGKSPGWQQDIEAVVANNPKMSGRQLSKLVGCSEGTIRNYRKKMR